MVAATAYRLTKLAYTRYATMLDASYKMEIKTQKYATTICIDLHILI